MAEEDQVSSVNAEKNLGDTSAELKTGQGFTPEPWSVHDGVQSSCKCLSVSGGSHPIASVEHGEWGDSYPSIRPMRDTGSIEGKFEAYIERIPYGSIPDEEALANARLIAAAPTLYQAALDLLDAMEMQEGRETQELHITQPVARQIWDEAKSKARAALARVNAQSDPPEVKD